MVATVVLLAAATMLCKGAGTLLPPLPRGFVHRLSGLAPSLLAALVYVELAGDDGVPRLDARLAGVAAAVALAALRAPFAGCVVAGAAVAAGLRALTGLQ